VVWQEIPEEIVSHSSVGVMRHHFLQLLQKERQAVHEVYLRVEKIVKVFYSHDAVLPRQSFLQLDGIAVKMLDEVEHHIEWYNGPRNLDTERG